MRQLSACSFLCAVYAEGSDPGRLSGGSEQQDNECECDRPHRRSLGDGASAGVGDYP
jgi:hypothetical protein